MLVVFSPQSFAQLRYTPIYLIFCFVIFAKHSITVRCASLKNIVALLAWSASHCSLFFHLRVSPESSAGRGESLRPTALHPDIFDFLLCQSCEFRYNNPLRFPQKHSRTARLERVALLVVFSPQSFAQLRYTPIYLIFCFVIFAKHSITVRCASLKNIVALLAWSASHCSLFFHLRVSPESSAGRGESLRPTALHPDIFDFFTLLFLRNTA